MENGLKEGKRECKENNAEAISVSQKKKEDRSGDNGNE